MLGVVIQIDGYDPVAAAPVTLYAASVDHEAVCHLNGQTWWPAIAQLPTLAYDLFDGAFGGAIVTPESSIILGLEPWPNLPRYALADAAIQLWTGEVGDPWGSWTRRFAGRVKAQPPVANGQAAITFAVDDGWLDGSLLATYAGTTGAEGPAALKGTPKPLALGAPRYAEGVLVNPTNSIFQLSGYGAIEDVEAALEGLARFGAPAADYASYAALDAATIAPGRWATAKAVGMVRLGAPPAGKISFLVKGDKAGPNGWARKPGQLIRRLALLAGGAGKIDDASLNALDTARPYNLSVYAGQQTGARSPIQSLAGSVNAVAGVTWLGKLFVAPVGIGVPTIELRADGSALPPVISVEQSEIAAPWWKLAIDAERTESVHALAEVAFTAPLIDMGDYAAGTTYREGNIVQNGGGSWVYINPTPTAGNAPPAAPATSNAWWKSFAAAGGDGAAGINSATVFLYQRNNTGAAPSVPAATLTYTFATGALSGTLGSWTQAVPAPGGGKYLFVTTAPALGTGAIDMIATGKWATVRQMAADGSDGGAGSNGIDAITFSALPDTITIACTAAGTPKAGQLPRVTQVTAFKGAVDVTATATYATSATGCTATNDGGGQFTITAMVADTASLTVTATKDGISAKKQITLTKVKDGNAYANGRDDTIGTNTSTSYSGVQGSVGPLLIGPGGAVLLEFDVIYNQTPGASGRMAAKVQYRNITDGGAWTDAAAEVTGGFANASDGPSDAFDAITLSAAALGIASAQKSYEFQLLNRRITAGGGTVVAGSYLKASWQ